MEKEMDKNVPHDLVLECRRMAEQLSEDDEGLDKMKKGVYTPNYERTDTATERSSIG